jgi:DNA-binding transcriptional regulator YdaS (Cro superfamily)
VQNAEVTNLRAETLARAAFVVGGVEVLAERLGITPAMLAVLIRGEAPIPADMFFLCSEIVTDASVAEAAKPRPARNDAERGKS